MYWDRADTKMASVLPGRSERRALMLAARTEDVHNHQVRVRKQPLLGLGARGLGGPNQRAELLALSPTAEVIQADSRQAGDFVFREQLLARSNGDHVFFPSR